MNLIDILIIFMLIGSLLRGYSIGFIRQLFSTIGFLVGLFIGSWASSLVSHHSSSTSALTSLFFVLVGGLVFMTIGETVGVRIKHKINTNELLDRSDGGLGSIMAVITVLIASWLTASILVLGPSGPTQQVLKSSRILGTLDAHLPPATGLLTSLNNLIDPNGFPQVFRGLEPNVNLSVSQPSLGSFSSVIANARGSVVRIEGAGCGGIVEGSGFILADGKVVTNAHVIAGVSSPKVFDGNGVHNTQVVWFDPNIDIAVLSVSDLAGKPLTLDTTEASPGTGAVILGYPGGGDFKASAAAVISHDIAIGRNIYDQGSTSRDIYSLKAKVIPGNSGGPIIDGNGHVLGIVFATSTTYNNVGYALTGHQVASELKQALKATATVGTGACSTE